MFRKKHDTVPSDIIKLVEALTNDDVKLKIVYNDRTWTFVNDLASKCSLTIDVRKAESNSDGDYITELVVKAVNGRLD